MTKKIIGKNISDLQILRLLAALSTCCVLLLMVAGRTIAQDRSVSENVLFGDPFILLSSDTYYMYGTSDSDTGIKVYRSHNLEEWEGPVGAKDGFALHKDDVYGNGSYWAPEVYHINGQYYMFFSVEEHITVATSQHPEGPFTQQNKSTLRDHKSIDNHLFIDDEGTRYIYFANFKNGLEIWGAKLDDDFSIQKESLSRLLHQSQDWERSPKKPVGIVNEGPFVIKHNGLYYLTYSANHYASQDYGIGMAWARNPLGEWTKSEDNPILQSPDHLVGTGHSSMFWGKNGNLFMVYHAHHDTSNVHPRKVIINRIRFNPKGGAPVQKIEILSPPIIPRVAK